MHASLPDNHDKDVAPTLQDQQPKRAKLQDPEPALNKQVAFTSAEHGSGSGGTTSQPSSPLTDTLQAAVEILTARKTDILTNIEVLTTSGVAFLDQVKAAFLQHMDGLKQEVQSNHDAQVEEWMEMSRQQMLDNARLQHVQQCVESLGLQVLNCRRLE